MTEIKKKKITVRKPRKRATEGAIKISRKRPASDHVVDLKTSSTVAGAIMPERTGYELPLDREVEVPVTTAPRWPFSIYKKIAVSFIVVVLLGLAAVSYFALVKLEVVIKPRVEAVTAAAPFTIYDRPDTYTLPAGAILGLVREMELEYTASYPASGEEVIGAEVSGTITLTNTYSKDQPLVATTRLLTPSNQLLRLRSTVVVPAGGSVQAEVYGEAIDPSFTLADTRLTIPGLWAGLQDKIYGEAKAGDVLYKEQKKLNITQADIDRAIEEAKQALIDKAAKEISDTYSAYDQRLYQVDNQSISFEVDGKVGEEKPQVTIKMAGKVAVVAFKNETITNLDETALASVLGENQSLVDSSETATSFKLISADVVQNIAEVELEAGAQAIAAPNTEVVERKKLVGLKKLQIESYLDSLPSVESYELKFSPAFLKVAPQLVDRITVKVQE